MFLLRYSFILFPNGLSNAIVRYRKSVFCCENARKGAKLRVDRNIWVGYVFNAMGLRQVPFCCSTSGILF